MYVYCVFLQNHDKTKISLTHPYPYSFHEDHLPCTIETSHLSPNLLFTLPAQLRVVEFFQPLSLKAKYGRIQIIEGLRPVYKPNTVLISKFSHMNVKNREITISVLNYYTICWGKYM